jgi:cyclic pyranopterin phosphate synthase
LSLSDDPERIDQTRLTTYRRKPEVATARLTHVNEDGALHMVDVGQKRPSARTASAEAIVGAQSETLEAIRGNLIAKGDVLTVAKIAGIQAAKRTSELIPLCHQIALSSVDVEVEFMPVTLRIVATAKTTDRTGVEMEALTAVAIAALTIYDMCKAVDKGMRIECVRLLAKSGGKCGEWRAAVEKSK